MNCIHHHYFLFFFLTDAPPTELYTLSLHGRSSDLRQGRIARRRLGLQGRPESLVAESEVAWPATSDSGRPCSPDRKSTRLNSSHITISYAVFCLKKKIIQPT